MDHLPIALRIRGRRALVIGGGRVAARKIEALLRYGATVTVVSPVVVVEIAAMSARGTVQRVARRFHPEHDSVLLGTCDLAVAATNERDVNRQVHAACAERHLPLNVVDDPELSTFLFPAVVERSPLTVAVSSGGASPVLARVLRRKLEMLIAHSLGDLATLAGTMRERVKRAIPESRARRRFWERIVEGEVASLVDQGRLAAAQQAFDTALEPGHANHASGGRVDLVGAGPGDPELLTVKALRVMHEADVIVHDRLVPDAVLLLARRDAEMMSVGDWRQEKINARLIALAQSGRRVCRLKGGDPFVFGRGGEELEALWRAGVECTVVPGITAALGCAASAGIPLTQRGVASACVLLTGNLEDTAQEPDWASLVAPRQTLIFYMAAGRAELVSRRLIEHGLNRETPVAVIENGTRADERQLRTTLGRLPKTMSGEAVCAPALIIVGEVVDLVRVSAVLPTGGQALAAAV